MTNENRIPGDGDEQATAPLTEPVAPAVETPTAVLPDAPAEPWLIPARTRAVPVPAGRAPLRWGGVVWGVVLLAFSALTLFVVSSPARLAGTVEWFSALTPGTAWALWIALVGVIIAVSAILGGVNAAQRRRRRHPA